MQPAAPLTLTGYRHSIYTRIARMALYAKGTAFVEVAVNPFTPPLPPDYPHPFSRVPVLAHGDFTLYETSAITRYIDLVCPGAPLLPVDPRAAARVQQVISIADAYAFRPLVLQVYAQRIFRPLEGLQPDETQVAAGLAAATTVLAALETITKEGLALDPVIVTLADCHLAPMIAAFAAADEGAAILSRFPTLADWWENIRQSPPFVLSGRGHMAPRQAS
jgi:glutathione S-transferase